MYKVNSINNGLNKVCSVQKICHKIKCYYYYYYYHYYHVLDKGGNMIE